MKIQSNLYGDIQQSEYRRYKINDLIRILCDTYFNQFPTKVRVSSTIKTEPMIVGDKFYKSYPYIRQEDIGTNTSNLFIDSLNISNLYLDGIGGKHNRFRCK